MQNNMITEDYVSYETAKLLKEKGFDVWGNGSYDSGIEIYKEYSPSGLLNSCTTSKPHPKGYPAPTLQMAMKWLRKAHKLCITIIPKVTDDDGSGGCLWEWVATYLLVPQSISLELFESYEEACEAGIRYCLENLI